MCHVIALCDLCNSIESDDRKISTAQSQAFHHRARHLLGVSHPGMLGHGQQNSRGLSSWFLRGRDRGMDHVAGLGPVRAASLEGVVGVALLATELITRRCLRRSEPPLEGARQPAAYDASTIHGTSHLCENDIARKSRKVSRVPNQLSNAMSELIIASIEPVLDRKPNCTTS